MDQRTEDFLRNAPDHPMRSRLEPHRELIRELRRKRYPYRKIATILRERFDLQTSKSALHDFVKVRARNSDPQRNQLTLPPLTPSPSPPVAPQGRPFADPPEAATLGPSSSSPPSQTDVYAHFEELKRRKHTPPSPQPKPRFHYEEGEPLRLVSDHYTNPIKRS
jgi:hypothetical protein